MHERTIAASIIDKAKEYGNVKGITVECGDLGHLPAEEMEEVLKELTDWNITIVRKKATVKCACGYQGEPNIIEHRHDHAFFKCPECRSIPEVLDGTDIILKEVDVE